MTYSLPKGLQVPVLHASVDLRSLCHVLVPAPLSCSEVNGSKPEDMYEDHSLSRWRSTLLVERALSSELIPSSCVPYPTNEGIVIYCSKSQVAKVYKFLMTQQSRLGVKMRDVKSSISTQPVESGHLDYLVNAAVRKGLEQARWTAIDTCTFVKCDVFSSDTKQPPSPPIPLLVVRCRPRLPSTIIMMVETAGTCTFSRLSLETLVPRGHSLTLAERLKAYPSESDFLMDPLQCKWINMVMCEKGPATCRVLPEMTLAFIQAIYPSAEDHLSALQNHWLLTHRYRLPDPVPFYLLVTYQPDDPPYSNEDFLEAPSLLAAHLIPSCCALKTSGISMMEPVGAGEEYMGPQQVVNMAVKDLLEGPFQLWGEPGLKLMSSYYEGEESQKEGGSDTVHTTAPSVVPTWTLARDLPLGEDPLTAMATAYSAWWTHEETGRYANNKELYEVGHPAHVETRQEVQGMKVGSTCELYQLDDMTEQQLLRSSDAPSHRGPQGRPWWQRPVRDWSSLKSFLSKRAADQHRGWAAPPTGLRCAGSTKCEGALGNIDKVVRTAQVLGKRKTGGNCLEATAKRTTGGNCLEANAKRVVKVRPQSQAKAVKSKARVEAARTKKGESGAAKTGAPPVAPTVCEATMHPENEATTKVELSESVNVPPMAGLPPKGAAKSKVPPCGTKAPDRQGGLKIKGVARGRRATQPRDKPPLQTLVPTDCAMPSKTPGCNASPPMAPPDMVKDKKAPLVSNSGVGYGGAPVGSLLVGTEALVLPRGAPHTLGVQLPTASKAGALKEISRTTSSTPGGIHPTSPPVEVTDRSDVAGAWVLPANQSTPPGAVVPPAPQQVPVTSPQQLKCPAARVPEDKKEAKKRVKASDLDLTVVEAKIRSRAAAGSWKEVTMPELQCFLKARRLPVGGKKADLEGRVCQWLTAHRSSTGDDMGNKG